MAKKVSDWWTEIENGLKYREAFARERAWAKLEMNYMNDPKGHTAIGPNLIYGMGDALLSALMVPDPEISVNPTHPKGVDSAPIIEAVDNWFVKKLKLKKRINLMLMHNYLYGKAIGKIGYDSEFGWSPYYDIGRGNNMMGMTMTQYDRQGKRIEFMNTTPGMPWFAPVLPHDFVVPWGTVFLEDAPWVAHRVVRLNSQLKADPKYKNTERLEPTMSMEAFIKSYMNVGTKRRRATRENTKAEIYLNNTQILYNEIWEIHDREDGRVKVVCFDHREFLRDEPDAMMMALNGQVPFVSGSFVDHPRSFWSTPLAYYLGQIQATQFDISKQAEKQRRVNVLKFLMDKGLMDADRANRLMDSDVGAVELVKSTGKALRDSVMAFPQGNMFDSVMHSNENQADARETVGFSRNQMGEFDQKTHRTKAETMVVQQGSQRREGKRAGVVVDLYIDIMMALNKTAFRFWKQPRYQLVGRDWKQFTGEELDGDYLYDLTLSTKRSLSRAQRLVESIMLSTQLMQMGLQMDPKELQFNLMAASGDPAFERLISPPKSTRGAQPGGVQQAGANRQPQTAGAR